MKNVNEFKTSERKYRLQRAEICFANRMVPINAPISQEPLGIFTLQKVLTLTRVQLVFHPSIFFNHSRYIPREEPYAMTASNDVQLCTHVFCIHVHVFQCKPIIFCASTFLQFLFVIV